jgi:hypothetical protein
MGGRGDKPNFKPKNYFRGSPYGTLSIYKRFIIVKALKSLKTI